ncbi:MAG: DUF2141 domain-containing protein [Desulfosarcinaceae bacterium]|nr:DUF2141 domain-containing protein [Desulfosarcinaceae bacterium]
MKAQRNIQVILVTISILFFASPPGGAAEIVVIIKNIASTDGEVGCGLFTDPESFPMGKPDVQVWLNASTDDVQCHFKAMPAGTYAVSVSHDLNGNRKVDTNFFGIPKEAWGVSNNVRPAFRPPRFDEAKFTVPDEDPLVITIAIDD